MPEPEKPVDANGGKASGDERSRCPICEEPVEPDCPTAPFCSGRCKLVDLGKWLSGDYVVSRDLTEKDFENENSG